MFSNIVGGLRTWRVFFCGLAVAGLLLGTSFPGNFGGPSYAWAKGHGKGKKGGKKRHGPKRHHHKHHSAKTHRHAKRREHHSHTSDHSHTTDVSHVTHTDVTHHHGGWDYYWGHHGYLDPAVVETDVAVPVAAGKNLYIVKLQAPGDRKNHMEEVAASTPENVKAKLLEKYSGADFKSIDLKPAGDGQDVYVVKFSTTGNQKDYVEDILASTGNKAKEQVLEKHADASFKSVDVKPVINAP